MRILTLYVLFDLIKVFVAGLVTFTGTMLLVGVVTEASKQGLPPAAILKLIPYVLPQALRVSIPVTLLLATTTVYSRMSGFNEVIAIKAMGISPMVLLWPALVLSIIFSFVTVWLNDVAVSQGRVGVQRVAMDAIEEIAYGMLRTERRYSSPNFSIIVQGVEDRQLIRPNVWIAGRPGVPEVNIEAQSAELSSSLEDNIPILKIALHDFRVESDRFNGTIPMRWTQEIPLRDKGDDVSDRPTWLPLSKIGSRIEEVEKAIERRKEETAAAAATQMLTGDFDGLTGDAWRLRELPMENLTSQLNKLRTEPYRRWSTGFSCLFFVWVGAPIALWARKCDFLQSFFVCFAPILVVYYPLLMLGFDRAKNGAMHPICVWAPNLVLAVFGIWFLRRVLRY
jgi:lipopolysaccharide export system permease protein